MHARCHSITAVVRCSIYALDRPVAPYLPHRIYHQHRHTVTNGGVRGGSTLQAHQWVVATKHWVAVSPVALPMTDVLVMSVAIRHLQVSLRWWCGAQIRPPPDKSAEVWLTLRARSKCQQLRQQLRFPVGRKHHLFLSLNTSSQNDMACWWVSCGKEASLPAHHMACMQAWLISRPACMHACRMGAS